MADKSLTDTDKADLISVLNKATGDYLSGADTESLLELNTALSRFGAKSTNKQFQQFIKEKVENNVATSQKGNKSSKFGEHAKNEQEIKAGKGIVGNSLEWNSWQNYKKTTINGKQYAQVGDRLYSQHAIDRMQPSGLGSPAGTVGAGRNISPGIVEYTIQNGTKTISKVNGVERTVHWSGDVGVVTENNGKVIVTILRRSEK
ncbi:hypothetical protein [Gilliamella sp. Choc4-2]|uniref:hypothetical protein n=1 Tax=Gilliamella sp. Choc4-2 TaxID=3120237 RepID=UPI0009BE697A|nr:hypothetical protein [Gilliamella apicola]